LGDFRAAAEITEIKVDFPALGKTDQADIREKF